MEEEESAVAAVRTSNYTQRQRLPETILLIDFQCGHMRTMSVCVCERSVIVRVRCATRPLYP